uniref:Uncharacterized protein n=1 Tax=Plectus sambesii TaxID=2011161 RepID=A0A914XEM3_9BILA
MTRPPPPLMRRNSLKRRNRCRCLDDAPNRRWYQQERRRDGRRLRRKAVLFADGSAGGRSKRPSRPVHPRSIVRDSTTQLVYSQWTSDCSRRLVLAGGGGGKSHLFTT